MKANTLLFVSTALAGLALSIASENRAFAGDVPGCEEWKRDWDKTILATPEAKASSEKAPPVSIIGEFHQSWLVDQRMREEILPVLAADLGPNRCLFLEFPRDLDRKVKNYSAVKQNFSDFYADALRDRVKMNARDVADAIDWLKSWLIERDLTLRTAQKLGFRLVPVDDPEAPTLDPDRPEVMDRRNRVMAEEIARWLKRSECASGGVLIVGFEHARSTSQAPGVGARLAQASVASRTWGFVSIAADQLQVMENFMCPWMSERVSERKPGFWLSGPAASRIDGFRQQFLFNPAEFERLWLAEIPVLPDPPARR
jgi:hypothetical protein